MCFNPRTHVGCDNLRVNKCMSLAGFNPRTHVGCDHLEQRQEVEQVCFNPRTHVGCDCATSLTKSSKAVSIHAPT